MECVTDLTRLTADRGEGGACRCTDTETASLDSVTGALVGAYTAIVLGQACYILLNMAAPTCSPKARLT